MLPLLLGAVDEGRLTLERMIDLTYRNPLRIYGLRPPSDSDIELMLGGPYRLPKGGYRTRCGWSPFAGKRAYGRVTRVRLRGKIAWRDGEVTVPPGYGQPLSRSI